MGRRTDTLLDTVQPLDKWSISARLAHDKQAAEAVQSEIDQLRARMEAARKSGTDVAEMAAEMRGNLKRHRKLAWMYRKWNSKDRNSPPWIDVVELLLASPVHTLVVKHYQKKDKANRRYARDYPTKSSGKTGIDWPATWKLHPEVKSTKVKSRWQKALHLTIQNLKRELREACVLRHGVLDLDMVAAHIAIVKDLLAQNGAPAEYVENVEWYLQNRESTQDQKGILERVQEAYGVDRAEAKTLLGNLALYQRVGWRLSDWAWKSEEKLPNGQSKWYRYKPLPGADMQFVAQLAKYIALMQDARQWLIERRQPFVGLDAEITGPRFMRVARELGRPAAKRVGSAFSYLLQSVERMLLYRCIHQVVREDELGTLWAPIHDGFNLKPSDPAASHELLTASCMKSVPATFPSVQWIVKPFDGWTPPADLPGVDVKYDQQRAHELAILEKHAPPVPGPTRFKVACTERYTARYMRRLEFGPEGGVVVPRSKCGTGKTHQNAVMYIEAIKALLQVILTLDSDLSTDQKLKQLTTDQPEVLQGKLKNVVALPRISLGLEYHRRMNQALAEVAHNAGFLFYRDEDGHIRDQDELRAADRIVIQVDSLYRLQGLEYEYLICDESEALVDQLISSKHAFQNTGVLLQLIRRTKHVIMQDAFADEATRRLLAYAQRGDNVRWIQNDFQPYAAREGKPQMRAYFHWEDGEVMERVGELLSDGKDVFVPCTSRDTGQAVMDKAIADWKLDQAEIIFIQGDDKLNGPEEKMAKMETLRDVNTAAKRARLFIISPSMTVGNSIDLTGEDAFDAVCAFVDPNSIGARDVLQQLARPRTVNDNEIHLQLNSFGGNPRTDVDACLKRKHRQRIVEEDFVEYFENVESLRRAHLLESGPVKLLHGTPCLDLETTKVRRAEAESNNALFFLEVLRHTEVRNRQLDMVDDIWSGLLDMGAHCEDWVTPETEEEETEGAGAEGETSPPAGDGKTLSQMKSQIRARDHLLVTEVGLELGDCQQIAAADRNHYVTLNDRQRAIRRRMQLQEVFGIGEEQWSTIQRTDQEAMTTCLEEKGHLPQSTWSSRYNDDAVRHYKLLQQLVPHAGDAHQQKMLLDHLAKETAQEPVSDEAERGAVRKRVQQLYRAKTAIDVLQMLGFEEGLFDRRQISAAKMLGSKQSMQKVARALGEWLGQLDRCDSRSEAEEMRRIAAGGTTKKRLSDLIGRVRDVLLKPCFGISLQTIATRKRCRHERDNPDLRLYELKLDKKFRIEGIADDGDATKPLVRKVAKREGWSTESRYVVRRALNEWRRVRIRARRAAKRDPVEMQRKAQERAERRAKLIAERDERSDRDLRAFEQAMRSANRPTAPVAPSTRHLPETSCATGMRISTLQELRLADTPRRQDPTSSAHQDMYRQLKADFLALCREELSCQSNGSEHHIRLQRCIDLCELQDIHSLFGERLEHPVTGAGLDLHYAGDGFDVSTWYNSDNPVHPARGGSLPKLVQ